MAFKQRTEPRELLFLRTLNKRMELSPNDFEYYSSLKKGYEGEVMFDQLTEKLQSELLILNDLLLEVKRTQFQIDTTIISQEVIYLFEVKNLEGDYYFKDDRFYMKNGKEIKNPLLQLKRCASLFRQFLGTLGYQYRIEPFLVFINPECAIYQAPLNEPIIFPTQLNRLMNKLNKIESKLSSRQKNLANELVNAHMTKSPYTVLPVYDYDQLEKRMTCFSCDSHNLSVKGNKLVCDQCEAEEKVEAAVLRNVEEFRLLFPDRKITTNEIYQWCGGMVESRKMIRRILKDNFKATGHGPSSYYE